MMAGLARHSAPARFTADEFIAAMDAGVFGARKLELADGEIVEVPLPGWTHAELQALIIGLLASACAPHLQVLGELTIRLGPSRVRDADAALGLRVRRAPGAVRPDALALAIEIADTTLVTDLHVKAREYAEAGIPAYWVIDADAAVIHTMRAPGPEGYGVREVVRFGEPLAVPGGGTILLG